MSFKRAMELSEDETLGQGGPTRAGELSKRSDHVREWRPRYFALAKRRLYYYDAQGEAPTFARNAHSEGFPKGYIDMVGATLSAFEERDDDGDYYYGLSITEEFCEIIEGEEQEGQLWRLCSSEVGDRDEWLQALQYSARPTWLNDSDPRTVSCQHSNSPFTLTKRRVNCRQCGGCFLKECTSLRALPELMYASPVPVCTP